MAGEPAAALEQLLPRFEALRNSGAIKVLVIEHPAGAGRLEELPPGCLPFARAGLTTSAAYGTSEGTGRRAHACRWLGDPARVEELLTAIEAAGQLLAVPLAKAGLINPADYIPPREMASRSRWLVAMLAAAEEGHLQADGIAGGGWRHWVPGGGIACDTATVELYRSPAGREAAAGDPVRLMVAAVDTSARYAVFRNAVESSIALLRHLAAKLAEPAKPKADKPRKQFRNLRLCLEHFLSTAGGIEQAQACKTLQDFCQLIKQEYPGQPITPSAVSANWPDKDRCKCRYLWEKQEQHHNRNMVPLSGLTDHPDILGR